MNDSALLQELADKEAIKQLMFRYCRGIDRRDLALIKSAYHPDATDDHGYFKGSGHGFAESVMDQLVPDGQGAIQHALANILIELDGLTASVESSFVQIRVHEPDERGVRILDHMGGRYLDRMEKRDGVWRILNRIVVMDWCENHPYNPTVKPFVPGCMNPSDPSYDFLEFKFDGLL